MRLATGPTTAICSTTWRRACSARWWWHERAKKVDRRDPCAAVVRQYGRGAAGGPRHAGDADVIQQRSGIDARDVDAGHAWHGHAAEEAEAEAGQQSCSGKPSSSVGIDSSAAE